MHYLQKSILDKLRFDPLTTYTALMPEGIESSHFRYHLKQLMTEDLVCKDNDGMYALTDKGQREVDYLSENRTTLTRTPKVITYTLLTHSDTLLLYKKNKEPYRGLLGLIGGKVNFGEDMRVAAKREVLEKTGLDIPLPRERGVVDIRIDKQDQPFSHVVAYIYSHNIAALPETLPATLIPVQRANLVGGPAIPDLLPILKLLDSETHLFMKHLDCQL